MDVITQPSEETAADWDRLRELLNGAMLDKGGGELPQSHRGAAADMGMNQTSLSNFIAGRQTVLDPVSVLRIARYIGMNPVATLRLAGYHDLAKVLADLGIGENITDAQLAAIDPYSQQFQREIADLDPEGKQAVLRTARSVARVLRNERATYTTTKPTRKPTIKRKHRAPK